MSNPAVIVSCDSHVGPKLREQLRPYCPHDYLDEFDRFAANHEEAARAGQSDPGLAEVANRFAVHPNIVRGADGHFDIEARLRDMNNDGVAAEVIYHFSQNGEPLPFVFDLAGGLSALPANMLELGKIGFEIYNDWLADYVSTEPERHIGLAYLPMWDVDAAVRELLRTHAKGLRGVNFPPPSRAGHLEYNNPAWEPFWAACEELNMALHTHASGAAPFDYFSGPGGADLLAYECGGWMARRALWWLTHGLVFERHPMLRLVITEQYEGWWTHTLREMDAVHERFGRIKLPQLPSEYARRNVLLGCSFLSSHLADEASRDGFAGNIMWGRDYPHIEGVWQHLGDPAAEPITKLALRNTLHSVPAADRARMAGENAVRELGLDRAKLASVAARIGAPSVDDLGVAPGLLPEVGERSNAFRGQAGPRL